MTSFIAKFVAKKILGERLENNYGKEVCWISSLFLSFLTNWLTGPIFRDRTCDPTRWSTIKQKGQEETKGSATRNFRAGWQSPHQSQASSIPTRHESFQLLRNRVWLVKCDWHSSSVSLILLACFSIPNTNYF